MSGQDARVWQHERMVISAATKVPSAPRQILRMIFKIISTIKQRFNAQYAIDVKAHLRFHVHMRQLSAQTSAFAISNTKES